MSKCPEITGLEFSVSGRQAIQAIRAKQKLANVLAGIMAVVPLIEIFGGRGGLHSPIGVGWNIAKHDWEEWAEVLKSVNLTVRNEVAKIAYFEYEKLSAVGSGKERDFWFAVANSCEP